MNALSIWSCDLPENLVPDAMVLIFIRSGYYWIYELSGFPLLTQSVLFLLFFFLPDRCE